MVVPNVPARTQGNITVELYWKHTPKTCKNFAALAQRGYYNNVRLRFALSLALSLLLSRAVAHPPLLRLHCDPNHVCLP